MSDEPRDPHEPPSEEPLDVVLAAEEGGVRVFWISTDTMQALVDRLALVLGEHLGGDDELHVAYNAMQSGWQVHDRRLRGPRRRAEPAWTELRFEYSAFVVLRSGRGA